MLGQVVNLTRDKNCTTRAHVLLLIRNVTSKHKRSLPSRRDIKYLVNLRTE